MNVMALVFVTVWLYLDAEYYTQLEVPQSKALEKVRVTIKRGIRSRYFMPEGNSCHAHTHIVSFVKYYYTFMGNYISSFSNDLVLKIVPVGLFGLHK